MFKNIVIAGIGGFIGTAARYVLSQYIHKIFLTNFPLGTLIINLIGCFLIGIIIELFNKGNIMSPEVNIFLTVGICGGFTTFSTFSYDSINMINEYEYINLIIYLGISIFIGLSLTLAGKYLVNYLWSFK
ncbi:MAG: fluoride efflux transporter CrcB [Candidatus Kapabacteria bacterium]|nr:fluoride efflux transporter CrcB [Candidatus Kapabacteria bacterium]